MVAGKERPRSLSRWTAYCVAVLHQFFECIFSGGRAAAGACATRDGNPPQVRDITGAETIFFGRARVSANIADAMPLTDRTLYIQGKGVGTTNVSIYDESMRLIEVLDLEVTFDAGNLQSKICASTGSNGIRVASDHGQIVLSGTVSSSTVADQAYNLAKAWAPISQGA